MEQKRVILTKDQAKALIGKRKQIHTFLNPGYGVMVGCDHSRKSILDSIDEAEQIEIGGDMCKDMGHGLVLWRSNENCPLFVEVDKDELQKLEDECLKLISE